MYNSPVTSIVWCVYVCVHPGEGVWGEEVGIGINIDSPVMKFVNARDTEILEAFKLLSHEQCDEIAKYWTRYQKIETFVKVDPRLLVNLGSKKSHF